MNWFAVYTKPRWEKKVAKILTTKGIENYCPLNKVQRQWSDRKKTILDHFFLACKIDRGYLLRLVGVRYCVL
jgi:hypothetical protein